MLQPIFELDKTPTEGKYINHPYYAEYAPSNPRVVCANNKCPTSKGIPMLNNLQLCSQALDQHEGLPMYTSSNGGKNICDSKNDSCKCVTDPLDASLFQKDKNIWSKENQNEDLPICLSSSGCKTDYDAKHGSHKHTIDTTATSSFHRDKKIRLNEANVTYNSENHATKDITIPDLRNTHAADYINNKDITSAVTFGRRQSSSDNISVNTQKRQSARKMESTCSRNHKRHTRNEDSSIHERIHQSKRQHTNGYMKHDSTTLNSEGMSDMYIDLGDCNYACEYCNAAFWYKERLKGYSYRNALRYSKCYAGGQVYLQKELEPPQYFKQIFKDKHFLANIRAYNQMFSMTSFGAEIDNSINNGKGPYVFKISGQIHHWIGTICPTNRDDPKFMQLYIYDTENEIANRMKPFGGPERSSLQPEMVENLIKILDEHNELVRLFRTARDKFNEATVPEFKIQLYNVVGAREYQLPSSNTLGAIVFEPDANSKTDYDIIIEYKDRQPKRINKLHSSFMSLQFPLLFVYGQPGFNTGMTLKGVNASTKRQKLSMNMYYKYQLHERNDQFGILFRAGRLFQQYVVTVYCAIEQTRLDFIRAKQNNLRSECLSGICDAMSRGDHFGADIGQKIILPSSFTGGPRYMYSHYLDALAICRVLGNPQYFITFTCNINWPEIKRHMRRYPELTPSDRADVIVRVFEQKVEDFLTALKEQHIFGHSIGVVYTIEFQKRGLPHCHTLLWLKSNDKIKNPEEVDNFISAELPDMTTDPAAYRVVADMMMHGPCGNANPKAPCMQEGMCTKKFPKRYNDNTHFDEKGHIHYRRRKTAAYVPKGELKLDNTYVVPYNRQLCLMFNAHINVEYCGWSMLIKYLFKYISKGTDRIAARIIKPLGVPVPSVSVPQIQIDEIQNFIDGRFLCPHEACWRILDFPLHHREPAVQVLAVHLKDMQKIIFRDKEPLGHVVTDDGRCWERF